MERKLHQTVIIDYGMGNLRSVMRKCERITKGVTISSKVSDIVNADKLILPGVGHFATGVKNLKDLGIWQALEHQVIEKGTPILGICLGMQLMAQASEEGDAEGFGWIKGRVKRFGVKNTLKFKVPHMAWNSVNLKKESRLYAGHSPDHLYYFVHSYHMVCDLEEQILTTSSYEYDFVSSVEYKNIYGVQFHPEKSHDVGQQMLSNFLLNPC